MPTGIDALATRVVDAGPTVGPVRLICVDGPAGSGKTTWAAQLDLALRERHVSVETVHGDEVYEGWPVVRGAVDRIDAFTLLPERMSRWFLHPWAAGRPGGHRMWDWSTDAWGEERTVTAADVVILEGVALGSRLLRSHAALSVWIEASPDVRLERVLARDGAAIRAEMIRWQADEDAWHALDDTRDGADVRLAT